ncbi:PREDICTED: uncharacterized protein LOC109241706 [Nicotiana attenuata]|uniref:uncharacterized protein LOC109241706 n=1 Tax=Nicotiana attenuata TaxID=49451 RepID=UPI0009058E51|nr:PREDICTED: uncharacterized protein LOC109241706 [Nicotiana attenuata]
MGRGRPKKMVTKVQLAEFIASESRSGNLGRNCEIDSQVVALSCEKEHQCDMWEALRRIDSQMTNSWLIMGDFNAVMDIEDRINGTVVQENEIKDFRSLMEDCRLNELRTVGRSYTWTNSHVYNKIDRAIVNAH